MKKFSAILLALILVLAMTATAFAANDGSITINNAIKDKEYKIYKVFDATYSGEGEGKHVSYTYTKTGNTDALYAVLTSEVSPFTLTATSTANVYNVSLKEGKTGTDIDVFMKANEDKLGTETQSITATSTTVKFGSLDYGYYYVTSTVGSVVAVTNATPNATLVEKNTEPDIGKTHSTVDLTAIVGTEVPFTITAKIGVGHTNYKVTDTLTGMTIKAEPVVTVEGKVVTKGEGTYTYDQTGVNSFVIAFADSYTASLAKDTVVTITYTGVITEAAVDVDTVKNTYKLSYDNNEGTDKDDNVVTPLEFDIVKTDNANKLLDGAKFKLTDKDGKTIKVVVNENYIRPAKDSEQGAVEEFTVTGGKITVKGIKEGEYKLVETEAPAGYNKLAGPIHVNLTADNKATVEEGVWKQGGVQITNQSGTELPSTGGMGTTIFYVVGGLMMAAAVVILVAKKKVAAEK